MANASRRQAILDSLNQAQRRAVTSDAATVAILAGPGSGKTHTLTSRVVWLVDIAGYRPQDVVVATFTVKASREMRERIGKALGSEREKKLVLGTFHSIARRYLAAYGKKIGLEPKFGITDDSDSRAIIGRICKRLKLAIDPVMARGWISKKKSKANDAPEPQMGAGRGAKQNPRGPMLDELETCYKEYQEHLERTNLLDYDDLLVKCVELLRRAPECVSNVQAVLIDEYQDTNGVQYELMKLLGQRCERITVVGDPDQSIYGWRSADIRNLSRMFADFPATDKVALEENYRSSERILHTSLKVIQQDEKRFEKVLKAVHTRGTRPVLRKLQNSAQEGEWIVEELRRAIVLSGNMMTHDDVAILLRSASLSRHVESALGKAGIPYRMVGGFKFYERAEIKVILDYLRVIHQPSNNDALARIINVPRRGVGDASIKSLLEEAEQASQSLWAVIRKHCTGDRTAKTSMRKSAVQNLESGLVRLVLDIRKRMENATPERPCGLLDVINHVLLRLDFEEYLEKTYPEEHEGRWANVQEFLNLATDFSQDLDKDDDALPEIDGLEQAPETEILPKFLANVSLASDVQKDDQDDTKPHVTVSTIHAAKGLEWPMVFIPAAYNGSIPHVRSEDSDEERRLLYVAMTRAKALLYLSYPVLGSYGSGEKVSLSSFLNGVQDYFAKQGPSFERNAVEEIGKILQRPTPSQQQIYGSLKPFEVAIEDDRFPIDPEDRSSDRSSKPGSRTRASAAEDGPKAKRPRFLASSGGLEQLDQSWHQTYATTMDQSAKFTVSNLPGFVTAGVHHATVGAGAGLASKGKGLKSAPSRQGPNQRSMQGFVTSERKGSMATPGGGGLQNVPPPQPTGRNQLRPGQPVRSVNGSWNGRQQPVHVVDERPHQPAIDPTLAKHRIGGGNIKSNSMSRPAPTRQGQEPARNHYAQFSSSPVRDGKPPDVRPNIVDAGGGGQENEVVDLTGSSPPPSPTRAASSFHTTTCSMPNGFGGFKRPAGLARDGLAPMDRLRKPFKPLTINRS